jgi:hypothetical protein
MWFAETKKLLDDIVEKYHSRVVDLKALNFAPTQKKARRGFK